jgi:hypothetical protein
VSSAFCNSPLFDVSVLFTEPLVKIPESTSFAKPGAETLGLATGDDLADLDLGGRAPIGVLTFVG